MLTAVKKGNKVNEEEIPPPVASGKSSATVPQAMHDLSKSSNDQEKVTVPDKEEKEQVSAVDHESKNPSGAELSVSKTALQGQDAGGGATGTDTTFGNSK